MTKTIDIGQLLMCGFDGLEPTEGILDLIRNHHLGAVILFSRNIESPKQLQRLTHQLQTVAKESGHARPLWIAVDQENGVMRRLGTSGTYLPGSMALGAIGSTSAAYQVAQATAKELLSLGINWNLAPVMDVNSNPLNPVIGVRSFGEDPQWVARLGCAQIEGYQKQGVATSIKHFPGHGDTATDSHLGVPVIDKSLEQLNSIELIPFTEAIRSQGYGQPASVMVAHIALPKLIQDGKVASLSSEVVTDLLRKRIGYNGIIITDCVEMDAVKETVGSARGAVMALEAGNDMVMISHTLQFQKEAFELIEQELPRMDAGSIRDSLNRVAVMKDQYLNWDDALKLHDLDVVGCKDHLKLSDRLYNHVPTIVRNRQKVLPLQPAANDKILFLAAQVTLTLAIDSETEPFNSMCASLQKRHANTEYIIFNQDNYPNMVDKISAADYVVIGTANANLYPFQSELVKLAHKQAKSLVVVSVINPYDLTVFPEIETYVVTYEYTPPAHEAFIRILFGEIEYRPNHLPVTITQDATVHHPCIQVEPFLKDIDSVHRLWKAVFLPTWPLSLSNFSRVLSHLQQPAHFVVHSKEGEVIGFAATQLTEKHGQLALLMVHPDHRQRGIGSALLEECMKTLKRRGAKEIQLGSTYPRFFCGLPEDQERSIAFFEHRGFKFGNGVWDLMGDLSQYEVPVNIAERMKKEGIQFETIQGPDDLGELLEFQQRYFPYWLSTYEHHAALGDYQDLLVARDGTRRIVASLILYTTKGSHDARTDLIWTDIFGTQSGGMACVGVASEERGRGIGLGIVAYANQFLRQRGAQRAYVDWVELIEFYGRTGYQTWRRYRLATAE
ncbi:hypothetical protein RMATCC62417_05067 [Rhizopus microsporus]|nr:hypothetical protein RMATCC62417_05067 [Rhizopus microsporus]